jgi:hypothetical protein
VDLLKILINSCNTSFAVMVNSVIFYILYLKVKNCEMKSFVSIFASTILRH